MSGGMEVMAVVVVVVRGGAAAGWCGGVVEMEVMVVVVVVRSGAAAGALTVLGDVGEGGRPELEVQSVR